MKVSLTPDRLKTLEVRPELSFDGYPSWAFFLSSAPLGVQQAKGPSCRREAPVLRRGQQSA